MSVSGRLQGRQTQFYIELLYGVLFIGGFAFLVFRVDPRVAAFEGGLVVGYLLRIWEKMSIYERILEGIVSQEAETQVASEVEEQVEDVDERIEREVDEQVGEEITAEVEEQVGDEITAEVEEQVGDEITAEVEEQVEDVDERIEREVDERIAEEIEDGERAPTDEP